METVLEMVPANPRDIENQQENNNINAREEFFKNACGYIAGAAVGSMPLGLVVGLITVWAVGSSSPQCKIETNEDDDTHPNALIASQALCAFNQEEAWIAFAFVLAASMALSTTVAGYSAYTKGMDRRGELNYPKGVTCGFFAPHTVYKGIEATANHCGSEINTAFSSCYTAVEEPEATLAS